MPKVGPYSRCRFCPLCGNETLQKDDYKQGRTKSSAEYICRTCGFGFRIGASARVYMIDEMHRDIRKQRTHKTMGAGVPPDVAEKCVEFLEGPMRKTSMRAWLNKWLPRLRRKT